DHVDGVDAANRRSRRIRDARRIVRAPHRHADRPAALDLVCAKIAIAHGLTVALQFDARELVSALAADRLPRGERVGQTVELHVLERPVAAPRLNYDEARIAIGRLD